MKTQLKSRSLVSALYTVAGVLLGIALISLFNSSVFADETKCYGQYGEEIECPVVQMAVSVDKTVRKADTDDEFVDELKGLKVGNKVEFKIVVTNTGETQINNLNVIDALPDNLNLSTDDVTWIINDFEPGDIREFYIIATTNDHELAKDEEKCVVNVVNLTQDGENQASDTAVVCLSEDDGDVLSEVIELPDTGPIASDSLIAYSIMAIILGLIGVTSTAILKEYSR